MSGPRPFDAADPGTDEATWLLDPRWDTVPSTSAADLVAPFEQVVVLAPHPDDESLGPGGVLAAAAAAGIPTHVVLASDGERSHPQGSTDPAALAAVRREEVAAAVAHLGASVELHRLALPDGGLADHVETMAAAVVDLVGDRLALVLAPWREDGHPDHHAAADAACLVERTTQAQVALVPVWLWHWATPDELPWDQLELVDLGPAELRAKAAAVASHRSQVEPLGPGHGDGVLLGQHVRVRFERVVETIIRTTPLPRVPREDGSWERGAAFDAMYAADDDPWDFGSWYERRKRALTLAVLAKERYGRVLDLGCATGELTHGLAGRADAITAVDLSESALEMARARPPARSAPQVRWVQGECPDVLRELLETGEAYDLVVLSEIGYFLTGSELLSTLRSVRRLLADGGELVLVHWSHPTTDIPLDGVAVHAQVRSVLGEPRVAYRDADVLLDVYGGQVR